MNLRINDEAPNFTANTTQGTINFHEWIGNSWAVLFSHPKDFTPICTTEMGELAKLEPEFKSRNVKLMGLSVDSVQDHMMWIEDIVDVCGVRPTFPIVADTELAVAKLYQMLPASEGTSATGRTATDNQTVRTVFCVGPDKKIKVAFTYPMTTGRNFKELLRVIDACQLTTKYEVATPANWQPGEDVIIKPTVSNEDAQRLFPKGFETFKPYFRKTADPSRVNA